MFKRLFYGQSNYRISTTSLEIAQIVNNKIEDALLRLIKNARRMDICQSHTARSLERFVFNTISGLRVRSKSGADKVILPVLKNT